MEIRRMTRWLVKQGLFCLMVVVFMVAVGRSRAVSSNVNSHPFQFISDQIVVKLATAVTIDEVNAVYGTTTLRTLLNSAGIHLLQLPPDANADALLAAMTADNRLLYAEMNYIGMAPEAHGAEIYGWPDNDADAGDTNLRTLYEWEMAAYTDGRYLHQPAVQRVNLAPAHHITQGAGVIVAVLDTGVDLSHPLLASRLTAARYDFVDDDPWPFDEFNGLDDDGDGNIDEVAGHGTHIAGIIRLVAPQAQIMPLRVLNSDGQGNIFVVAEAILFAAEHGAQVINLSLGTIHQSAFLTDVLSQVEARGVVVVSAAGNMNMNLLQFPAATACSLAVTSLGPGPIKSRFASYGSWVDVAAPGYRIYSAYPNNSYAWWSGTSMATPFVSGQVALLRSVNPALTVEDIGRLIGSTATSVDQQNQNYAGLLGAGQINIGDSVLSLTSGQWANSTPDLLAGCGY
jgi:subtilisin family serine protease